MSIFRWMCWRRRVQRRLERASAQHSPVPDSDIVVTATRVPTPLDEILPSTIVIDRETIDRSWRPTPPICCGSTPGSSSPATAVQASRRRCSSAARRAITRSSWSTACASIPGTIGIPALQNLAPELIEQNRGRQRAPIVAVWHGRHRRRHQRDHAARLARRLVRGARLRRRRHTRGEPQRRSVGQRPARSISASPGSKATAFRRCPIRPCATSIAATTT